MTKSRRRPFPPPLYHAWAWLLVLFASAAQAGPHTLGTVGIADLEHRLLRAPTAFLITEELSSLEDIIPRDFRPLTRQHVNQGISDRTFWLRLRLSNAGSSEDRGWVMHHETSYLDNMTIYLADAGQPVQRIALSDRVPFHDRPFGYRKLAFDHTTPAGEWTDLYLRLHFDEADSISLNVHLWERKAFEDSVRWENLLYGGYFGIMLTLIFITFLFTFVMREATYLYYGLFLIVSALMWALINGYAFQYLWPAAVFWHNEGFHILYLLFSIAALQFSRAFLHTRRLFPRCDRVILGCQAVMALGIGMRFAGEYALVLHLAFLGLLIPSLLLPALGWSSYRRGVSYARWFAMAWLFYSVGLIASLASAYSSVFSWGMEPLIYTQIGGLVESLMLLVALAERLTVREGDRRKAILLATQDPLTNLGNRRLLAQEYTTRQQGFPQQRIPTYLLLIDLDHFKAINDTFGHDAGDCILRDLARILRHHSRVSDVCIRLGGEEFALLLQVPDQETARQVAERIRQEFANTPTHYQGRSIPHTLSIGLCAALTDTEQLSLQDALIRADNALYRAKASNRNCTILHA
ncbi:sensor domain-containing diguanylate cyclase [Litchfieldella rifensis]|uniref:diguanylate cyclase n=1 Tax=Litchfieldella rifensis TaxID=762643 RepID=A0ABV7LRV3_9GAMM